MSSTSSIASLAASLAAPQTSTIGSSTFASDLQASVTRALEIAALPMQALQQDQAIISGKTSELSTLGGLFDSLQTALQAISSGTGGSALQATVSDTSVLSASVGAGALAGTYTVDVLNPGSAASAISSSAPVTDPTTGNISSSTSFTLTAGASTYQISANNLSALATAINSSGAPVQAVVVNLGSPSSPNYQLSLQSTALGTVALQLNDGTNNLLSSLNGGADATYTVDGQPSPNGISSNSATVTIAPGLNVTLEQAGTTTVTVSSSLSSVSSELSSFVTAYNSAFTELQKNFGKNGGALVGDSSVQDMQQALNQLIGYKGTGGSITSLAQLGVEYTQQGTLTFNSSAIAGLSQTQVSDALTFLGGVHSGGFLEYANNTLNGITDPIGGAVATETQALETQNQSDQTHINNDQAQLTLLQTNLEAQMAQANALIAALQNQTTFLQGLFQYGTSSNPYASTTG
jgi:flagellar hook-associated protein 2